MEIAWLAKPGGHPNFFHSLACQLCPGGASLHTEPFWPLHHFPKRFAGPELKFKKFLWLIGATIFRNIYYTLFYL